MHGLISPEEFQFQKLKGYLENESEKIYIAHDKNHVAILFSIIPFDIETYVHYLTDHIGLLCENETNEVVGFQIEI